MVVRKVPIDFAIPMLVGFGVGLLINFAGEKVIDRMEIKAQEDVYSDTLIGAAATENVPVVTSVAEMLEEEYFTFHIPDNWNDSVYYDGTVYSIYELESGERVLVDDYYPHTHIGRDETDEDDWLSSLSDYYWVLPIGRVVEKPLDKELINKIKEEGYAMPDTRFYVDMKGDFEIFSREDCEATLENISVVVGIVVFFMVRYLLIVSGVFSPLFPLRFLKKWKRFIVYYGVVYYDENVVQIAQYYKQKRYVEAAKEFARLTNVSIEEATEAIRNWNELYGEGILHYK